MFDANIAKNKFIWTPVHTVKGNRIRKGVCESVTQKVQKFNSLTMRGCTTHGIFHDREGVHEPDLSRPRKPFLLWTIARPIWACTVCEVLHKSPPPISHNPSSHGPLYNLWWVVRQCRAFMNCNSAVSS